MATILVTTSTFPRWADDTVPARFVFDLSLQMAQHRQVIVLVPHAPAAGDADRVRQILYAAPSLITEQNPDTGRTPLQHAVMGHHTKAVATYRDT